MIPPTFRNNLELEVVQALSQWLAHIEPIPLSTWRERVLELYGQSPRSTRDRMRQALAEALALAGPGATTADLSPELIARFGRRPGAASTTNGLLASLRRACRLAEDNRLIEPSKLRRAPWRVRETPSQRIRHHSRQDIARVLAELERESDPWQAGRLHALTATFAYTGLRLREALRMRREDIDLARGFCFVVAREAALKTERSAAPVPCPLALIRILRPWLERVGSEWVFPNLGRRGPWIGGTYGRRPTDRIVAAGRAVGVAGFTPQSLRHSLATHYASYWGLSERQVQLVLRHTTPLTQRYYVHADLTNLGELVRDFDFGPPRARGNRRSSPARALLRGRKRRRPPPAD